MPMALPLARLWASRLQAKLFSLSLFFNDHISFFYSTYYYFTTTLFFPAEIAWAITCHFRFQKTPYIIKHTRCIRNGAPCVFLNLYFLCNLLIFHQLLVGEKISDKQNTGQSQSTANAGIEERNELFGEYAGSPESDAAAHHAGHNHICLQIKEMPERTAGFVTDNPFRTVISCFAGFVNPNAAKSAIRRQKIHRKHKTRNPFYRLC